MFALARAGGLLSLLAASAGCLGTAPAGPFSTSLFPDLPTAVPTPIGKMDPSLLDLPGFDGYKADLYLAAAAKLQAAGREKAVATLGDLTGVQDRNEGRRVIILCRMLFRARPNGEFRRPGIGAPVFVGKVESNDLRAQAKDWPREPIDLVDGVPFLVVRGYCIGGYPEPARDYLDYCVRNCDWSAEAFGPKTAGEKREALAKLVASPRWKESLPEEGKKALAAQVE
jgi:hypothetical protein